MLCSIFLKKIVPKSGVIWEQNCCKLIWVQNRWCNREVKRRSFNSAPFITAIKSIIIAWVAKECAADNLITKSEWKRWTERLKFDKSMLLKVTIERKVWTETNTLNIHVDLSEYCPARQNWISTSHYWGTVMVRYSGVMFALIYVFWNYSLAQLYQSDNIIIDQLLMNLPVIHRIRIVIIMFTRPHN